LNQFHNYKKQLRRYNM